MHQSKKTNPVMYDAARHCGNRFRDGNTREKKLEIVAEDNNRSKFEQMR